MKLFCKKSFITAGASLLILAGSVLFNQVQAQFGPQLMTGTSGFNEKGEEYSDKYYKIKPLNGEMALLRDPLLEDGQFILNITVGDPMTGCFELSDIGYEAEFVADRLKITTGEMEIDIRNAPQNPHFECNQSLQQPSVNIILSRDVLKENNTKVMEITDSVNRNFYAITLTDEFIRLLPDASDVSPGAFFKPQKITGRTHSLTYWFYPENTLLLYAPTASNPDSVKENIDKWAAIHNLRELSSLFPSFVAPVTNPQYFYFVDEVGYMAARDGLQRGIQIGEIPVKQDVYTLESDESTHVTVPLFARKPGASQ